MLKMANKICFAVCFCIGVWLPLALSSRLSKLEERLHMFSRIFSDDIEAMRNDLKSASEEREKLAQVMNETMLMDGTRQSDTMIGGTIEEPSHAANENTDIDRMDEMSDEIRRIKRGAQEEKAARIREFKTMNTRLDDVNDKLSHILRAIVENKVDLEATILQNINMKLVNITDTLQGLRLAVDDVTTTSLRVESWSRGVDKDNGRLGEMAGYLSDIAASNDDMMAICEREPSLANRDCSTVGCCLGNYMNFMTTWVQTEQQWLMGIRLVNGSTKREGRVEVRKDRYFATVCDDHWDDIDAGVVCKMLGFHNGGTAVTGAKFGHGMGMIGLDDVVCNSSLQSLLECAHRGWGVHNCGHAEDAGVICAP